MSWLPWSEGEGVGEVVSLCTEISLTHSVFSAAWQQQNALEKPTCSSSTNAYSRAQRKVSRWFNTGKLQELSHKSGAEGCSVFIYEPAASLWTVNVTAGLVTWSPERSRWGRKTERHTLSRQDHTAAAPTSLHHHSTRLFRRRVGHMSLFRSASLYFSWPWASSWFLTDVTFGLYVFLNSFNRSSSSLSSTPQHANLEDYTGCI